MKPQEQQNCHIKKGFSFHLILTILFGVLVKGSLNRRHCMYYNTLSNKSRDPAQLRGPYIGRICEVNFREMGLFFLLVSWVGAVEL